MMSGGGGSSGAAPTPDVSVLVQLLEVMRLLSGRAGAAAGSPAGAPPAAAPAPAAAARAAEAAAPPPGAGLAESNLAVGPTAGLPPWAEPPPDMEACGGQRRQQGRAAEKVASANAAGERLDLVLWGDSLTAALARSSSPAWPSTFGDLQVGPCSVGTVQLLTAPGR